MITVDFHCHTLYSKDSLARLPAILQGCARKGLDRIAITDHNTIQGALLAREHDQQRVIMGMEIKTQEGEVLAFYVKEAIPTSLPAVEAIQRLRDQGAFISISHPFDRYRKYHWTRADLERVLPYIDAIETFNARCILAEDNRHAQEFARVHNLLGTAGSDAHTIMELGRGCLSLPEFSDAESLRRAMKQAVPHTRLSPAWIHLTSTYAKWAKRKGFVRPPG